MKKQGIGLIVVLLICSSLACSFSDRLRNVRVIDRLLGDSSSDVESAPQDVVQEFTDDAVKFTCQAKSLEPYMGENWKLSPTDLTDLILDVNARGDLMDYGISFSSSSDFIVERDPDNWQPPGATQVPEGVYNFLEKYQSFGTAQLDGKIFKGKIRVDYENILDFPTPDIKTGSLEFPVVANVNMGDLELCFGVLPDQVDATASDPGKLLRPNCRWPGYIFVCTAAQ